MCLEPAMVSNKSQLLLKVDVEVILSMSALRIQW